ncbi:hypothetical protein CDAR_77261 [Caerostris darwini]|uniref:Uncharacterized protein n=1 Tax=Caerostris darwini TaxID=1538125 RepID=A0AAV4TRX5_9ARAC|nr:hypothetical protein CDAR_77261 [Caerostris darwini]
MASDPAGLLVNWGCFPSPGNNRRKDDPLLRGFPCFTHVLASLRKSATGFFLILTVFLLFYTGTPPGHTP